MFSGRSGASSRSWATNSEAMPAAVIETVPGSRDGGLVRPSRLQAAELREQAAHDGATDVQADVGVGVAAQGLAGLGQRVDAEGVQRVVAIVADVEADLVALEIEAPQQPVRAAAD